MGIRLEDIKDPALRARIAAADHGPTTRQNPLIQRPTATTTDLNPKERRLRQSAKPLMNKLETAALAWLQHRYPGNDFHPQAKRFMLGNGIWYKPDFTASGKNFSQEHAWEVKGPHAFRGGFENLKVAAHQWPEVVWTLVWRDHGQWREQLVLP